MRDYNQKISIKFTIWDGLNIAMSLCLILLSFNYTWGDPWLIFGITGLIAFLGSVPIVAMQFFFNLIMGALLYLESSNEYILIADLNDEIAIGLILVSILASFTSEMLAPENNKLGKTLAMILTQICALIGCFLMGETWLSQIILFALINSINSSLSILLSFAILYLKTQKGFYLRE